MLQMFSGYSHKPCPLTSLSEQGTTKAILPKVFSQLHSNRGVYRLDFGSCPWYSISGTILGRN